MTETAIDGRNPHPLEPLDENEFRAAAKAVRSDSRFPVESIFVTTTLREPAKAALVEYQADGRHPPREADVVLYDRRARQVVEVRVSLADLHVISWRPVDGARPKAARLEFEAAESAVKAHPEWQQALRRRGVEDFEFVEVQPWPPGYADEEDRRLGARVAKALTWVGRSKFDNTFARPVEHLVVTVDLDTATVLAVDDRLDVPLPRYAGNYAPELAGQPGNRPVFAGERRDLRPIEITQPDGPSFRLDGHEVWWQKWHLVVGFTPREGLVLHQIRYLDGERERSVVHRASLSEMWVPYGDPAPAHRIKDVFDEGEAGLGSLANSLTLGCDCLGEIRYLDAVVNEDDGEPSRLANAVCIHEEDTGIAWKHTQHLNGSVEVRRGRRLVISSMSTIGNYDYGFFWYLHTDGSIAFEVKLTGIISTGAVAEGQRPDHGTIVAPGLYGPNHQHFFNVRLDVAVDGPDNSVVEVDSVASASGPANPAGNAWVAREHLIADEAGGQRLADSAAGRTWMIVNETVKNAHGGAVGYQLVPGPSTLPPMQPDAPALARAQFATRHLWVTAYEPSELFAAGSYPYQHPGGAGLPSYVQANRPVRNTDIVVWHTFAAHHVVRPEDWPVMPVSTTGFHLRPFGFFDANPALDLPRPHSDHCHADGAIQSEPETAGRRGSDPHADHDPG